MTIYLNRNGDSGIVEYDIGEDYVIVHFGRGEYRHYRYDYDSSGKENIEYMKKLAAQGFGLNEFINKYIKKNFASKW